MNIVEKNSFIKFSDIYVGNIYDRTKEFSVGSVYGIVSLSARDCIYVNGRSVYCGEYFCINAPVKINAICSDVTYIHETSGLVNEVIAGKIGLKGNQLYIDGCMDSLLVCPRKLGESCLNALYFPYNTKQEYHFHPSLRCGIVLRGKGKADIDGVMYDLCVGDTWVIPPNVTHRFITDDEELVVVAYHPDSDWGPTDEKHPMINRTLFGDNSEFLVYNFI